MDLYKQKFDYNAGPYVSNGPGHYISNDTLFFSAASKHWAQERVEREKSYKWADKISKWLGVKQLYINKPFIFEYPNYIYHSEDKRIPDPYFVMVFQRIIHNRNSGDGLLTDWVSATKLEHLAKEYSTKKYVLSGGGKYNVSFYEGKISYELTYKTS